jgi:hypothetical protein
MKEILALEGTSSELYKFDFAEALGYFVYATEHIKTNKILCEYAGEIGDQCKLKDGEFLYIGKSTTRKEIVISTEFYCNEGRFFSGLSCAHLDKINCELVCFSVNGVPRCFIRTTKSIEAHDIFYIYYGTEYDQQAVSFAYYKSNLVLSCPGHKRL